MSSIHVKQFDELSAISGGRIEDIESLMDQVVEDNLQNHWDNRHLYFSKSTDVMTLTHRESIAQAQEVIKRCLQNALNIVQEHETAVKIPRWTLAKTIQLEEKMTICAIGIQDNSQNDYRNKAFIQDEEPPCSHIDAWIRAKVQIDAKTIFEEAQDVVLNNSSDTKRKKGPASHVSSRSFLSKTKENFKINAPSNSNQVLPGGIADNKPKYPEPIDLYEPPIISDDEENLRIHKDNERKIKDNQIDKEKKLRIKELNEEQQKFQKFQKENKAQSFTYDYDGNLLPVQKIKLQRLPPSTYNMNFDFIDELKEKDLKKKKSKKLKTNDSQRSQQMDSIHVKIRNSNQDLQDQAQQSQQQQISGAPPIFENLVLANGVSLTQDGIKRQGPRPQTVDFGSLTTGDCKIRLGKKQYEELIYKQSQQQHTSTLRTHHKNADAGDNFLPQQQTQGANKGGFVSQTQKEQESFLDSISSNMNFFNLKPTSNKQGKGMGGTYGSYGSTMGGGDGGILINSAKMYETLTFNMISEEEEILFKMNQQKQQLKYDAQKKKAMSATMGNIQWMILIIIWHKIEIGENNTK